MSKMCKTCGDEIEGAAHLICPACAVALADVVDKRMGMNAEIRAQVIETLKMALNNLELWHKELEFELGDNCRVAGCGGCDTCQIVIPKVRAALEVLSAQIL